MVIKMGKRLTQQEIEERYPVREFECANCHRKVVTDNSMGYKGIDKRTRFCCAHCERQYWRKVTRHPTHLTNMLKWEAFRDVNKFDE